MTSARGLPLLIIILLVVLNGASRPYFYPSVTTMLRIPITHSQVISSLGHHNMAVCNNSQSNCSDAVANIIPSNIQ